MKRFFPHAICSGLTVMAVLMLWSAPFASARERRAEPAYDGQGWRLAVPGWNYTFPTDHGTHDEFQTEWWYFTGNLREVGSGRRFGYQLTFFRQGITPPAQFAREAAERPDQPLSAWRLRNLYFAHFALADVEGKKFEFAERLSRGTLGLAFYSQNQFWVQIGDWFARAFPPLRQDARPRMEERFELQAGAGNASIHLVCTRAKPAVFHGRGGVSQKAEGLGRATHYYSMTRLDTEGTVTIGRRQFAVEGLSWFDKEFGTNQLDKTQVGWDWMSLQLDNGAEIMVYGIREESGGWSEFSSGTYIDANGRARHLAQDDFVMKPVRHWTSTVSGAVYPVEWTVQIAPLGLELRVSAVMDACELNIREVGSIDYWEGPVDVRGSSPDGETVKGHGYLEMTGYNRKLSTR